MSSINDASLILTPNAISAGKLYSVIPTDGSGDMTVVRGTNATRIDSAGLVEIPRTNLLQRSEEFSDVFWGKSNATINTNTTTAPNDTLTADKLVENTTLTQHAVTRTVTSISNQTATLSIYLKRDGRDSATIFIFDNSYTNGFGTNVNLLTGTITLNYNQGTGVRLNSSITDAGNGWYRCTITGIVGGTSNNITLYTAIGTNTSYTGDGTSGVFVWGAQLETGNEATEYIPTVASIRTSFSGITQDGGSASNIARLNYDTVGGCPAILIEPQRTNLLTRSEEFNNVIWTKLMGSTITLDSSILNPAGGTSNFIYTASNLAFGGILRQSITVVSGQSYTVSFFVKKNNYRYVGIRFNTSQTANRCPNYDFDTDTLNKQGVTCDLTRVLFPNGWVRLILTFVTTSTAGTTDIALTAANGDTNVALTGTEKMFVWGAQNELGTYPTSYIPTLGGIQTRNADLVSKTAISSLIGQTEGTMFLNLKYYTNINFESDIRLNDGTSANSVILFNLGMNPYVQIRSNNVLSVNLSLPAFTYGEAQKIAITYKNNEFKIFQNGVLRLNQLTGNAPLNLSNLFLSDTARMNNITSMQLYKTALTDTELQNLTTL